MSIVTIFCYLIICLLDLWKLFFGGNKKKYKLYPIFLAFVKERNNSSDVTEDNFRMVLELFNEIKNVKSGSHFIYDGMGK